MKGLLLPTPVSGPRFGETAIKGATGVAGGDGKEHKRSGRHGVESWRIVRVTVKPPCPLRYVLAALSTSAYTDQGIQTYKYKNTSLHADKNVITGFESGNKAAFLQITLQPDFSQPILQRTHKQ